MTTAVGVQVSIGGDFHTQATFLKEEPPKTGEVGWIAEAPLIEEVALTEGPRFKCNLVLSR
ncbi:MAG: hypothetical protein SWH78_04610 [Thermodesulfobacteriota bacterium]|nr:hypothetical protein [Thermodesulfobacteriota bacterium]